MKRIRQIHNVDSLSLDKCSALVGKKPPGLWTIFTQLRQPWHIRASNKGFVIMISEILSVPLLCVPISIDADARQTRWIDWSQILSSLATPLPTQ
jgi:hypothetical protein